jgi:hypothetical protein
MAKYKYAFDKNGLTVSAEAIARKPVNEDYWCIGCESPVIAKVNGEIKKPHFAHKAQVECNGETYLHKLGKSAFVETYRKCLELGNPFIIKVSATKICTKMSPIIMKNCIFEEIEKEYDLTDYYQEVFVEKKDGEFIPDVLLVSTKNPDQKIFIEIACTHFLSEKKEQSMNRIIEIPIESEDDIEKIKKASLSPADAMFVRFNHSSETVTDSECRCARRNCYAFYVYHG